MTDTLTAPSCDPAVLGSVPLGFLAYDWQVAASGRNFDVRKPATETGLASVADCGADDVLSADLGPLVDHRAVENESRGDEVVATAPVPGGPGHYAAPAVLDHVPADAVVMHEEVFGPVAAIRRFSIEAQGIAAVNSTEHGPAAYLITGNLDRARRVAGRLQTGMVGLNRGLLSDVAAPFGGVKQSGLGRERGPEGLQEYQQIKYLPMPGFYTWRSGPGPDQHHGRGTTG
jgi:acyl-CoA reductase-like NAD-dependent aldehyde dehydrogenase